MPRGQFVWQNTVSECIHLEIDRLMRINQSIQRSVSRHQPQIKSCELSVFEFSHVDAWYKAVAHTVFV